MNSILEMKLHKASLTPSLKGRVTKPTVGAYDSEFPSVYVPAVHTNLAETFKRALAQVGERKVEKVL